MMAKRVTALVVLVAGILTAVQPLLARAGTMNQLQSAAKQLDAATSSGGPTAAQNQKIQE